MPLHPDILSDIALRNVREGSSRPPGQMSATELPPVAASWASTEKLPVGSWKERRPRYTRGLSPCLVACPVGNDVEGFVSSVREGDIERAVKLLAAEAPLPATCGRICYHPCESGCNRTKLDSAIGVRAIERYLGDLPLFDTSSIWNPARLSSGKRIAVAGAGPSGLSCAWALTLLGHEVEIYERAPEPGGLLLYGISANRLPKDILSHEINRIKDIGVRINCGEHVGTARELGNLLDRFDAVFVATDAVRSKMLGLKRSDTAGNISALDFLSVFAEGRSPEIGDEVIVVGGGNSAIDAARSARRLGAVVTILYRRTRKEMPAFEVEIDNALAEGVNLEELAIPVEPVLENGCLTGMKCLKTRLGEPDESGRRSSVPIPGSEFLIQTTSVINAFGEMIDREDLTENSDFQKVLAELDPWGSSGVAGLFAGGDFTGGAVAHAIGGGKRAAMAIDRYLSGKKADPLDRYRIGGGPASLAGYLKMGNSEVMAEGIQIIQYEDLNPVYFPEVERVKLERNLKTAPENDIREVEAGLTPEQATEEATRCFSCGRCTNCGLCNIFCPEGAVRYRDTDKDDLTVFDSHCKGCGICVEECPRCAIVMEPVTPEKEPER